MQIYEELFMEHGAQGWWPVTPQSCHNDGAKPIYGIGLKNDKQRLEIIFGAVLTQNTQWKPNVETAIIELNRLDLIDISRILKVQQEVIAEAIRSSGYYNEKAKKLKRIAEFLRIHPVSELKKLELAETRVLLLGINGIGPETADSILLYALDKPIFVVDAYTKRLFSKLKLIEKQASYDEVQSFFMDNLVKDTELFNEYHALIVAHCKKYSKKGLIDPLLSYVNEEQS